MFVSMYLVDVLCILVLMKCPSVEGFLWGPVVYLFWSLELGILGECVVLFEPKLLLACHWIGLTLRLTGSEG